MEQVDYFLSAEQHMHEWIKTFKLLGNFNRLQILKLLTKHRELPVKAIADKLDLSVKRTSHCLVMLSHADLVLGKGKLGSVYYSLHPKLRFEVQYIIRKFIP